MTGFTLPDRDPNEATQPQEPTQPIVQPDEGADPLGDVYDDERRRIAAQSAEREQDFLAGFRQSLRSNPDQVGEAQRIAQQIDQPPGAVEKNLDVAREMARVRALRYQTIARSNPVVLKSLENPNFLRLAHDDLDNLIATDTVWQMIGRSYTAGQAMNDRGFLGARKAMGIATAEDEARLEEVQAAIQSHARDKGMLSSAAEVIGQMAGTFPKALAVGAGAALPASLGGPVSSGAAFTFGTGAALFTQTSLIEGGNAYLDLLDQKVDPDTAAAVALGVGLVNGALEVAGVKVVAKPFQAAARQFGRNFGRGLTRETAATAFKDFALEYVKGVGAEVSTEVLQEVSQIVGEAIARPDGAPEPTWSDIRERLAEIAGKTTESMALLGLPGPALHFYSQSQMAARTQEQAEAFTKAVEIAAESRVRDRNPAQHQAFAQRVADEVGVSSLYFDAPRFAEAMERAGVSRAELEAKQPEMFRQLEKAEQNGDLQMDVVVPAGKFQADLAKTALGKELMPHARFESGGMSMQEAQTWISDQKKLAAQASSLVYERARADEEFAQSARKLEDTLYTKIAATRRLQPKEARSAAGFYRAFFATQAAELGISPEDLHARFPLDFEAATSAAPGDLRASRGSFDPSGLVVKLFEKADASSFLHEGAHFFLHAYGEMARSGQATGAMRENLQKLLTSFGVPDIETWNGMSIEQQRKHHEAFAYGFEQYVFEGKAPSQELQPLFDRFLTWLREIYKRVIRGTLNALYREEFGEDLPILTGEVRQVMDRMLASEEQVASAEAVRSYVPLFQTQEQAGMSDAEWAAYKEMDREQRAAAQAALTQDSMRQMQWLSGARAKLLKEKQDQHKAIREKVRREVVREVAATPRDRVHRWLKSGKFLNEDGTTTNEAAGTVHKLDTASLQAVLPKDVSVTTARLKGLHQVGGLDPEAVAERFGFTSAERMAAALLEMEPFEKAVERRTDERMLAEHGELADPAEVEAAVERALHNEARRRMLGVELRHLSQAEQPVRVMLAAAKEAAKQAILEMPVRDVSRRQFAAAEGRARRNALNAANAGDTNNAIDWKRKEMLQHALVQVGGQFEDERDTALSNMARFTRSDEKLAKSRNTDMVNAARWILSRYGLMPPSEQANAQRAIDSIRAYNPALYARFEPMLLDAAQEARDYRDLTVERFRDLVAATDALWFQSKRDRDLIVDGQREVRADAIDDMLKRIEHLDPKTLPGQDEAVTRKQRVGMQILGSKAWLRRVEHWATKLDGGTPGPWTRFVWRQLRKGVDDYRHGRNTYVQKLRDLVLSVDQDSAKIEAPELGYTFQGRRELLGALLHSGNQSNLNRLLGGGRGRGRAWTAMDETGAPVFDTEGNVSTAKWDRFVARMISEGKLTKRDYDFLQAVWDLNEELKPQAQKAHHDLYGFYFEEIPARQIETPWGTYRGGYVPAKVDPELVPEARQREVQQGSLEEIGQDVREAMPSTGKGFTISRLQGYARPLRLDVRLQVRHMDEVLRFVHIQPATRDVLSILRDRRFADALNRIDPTAIDGMLMPWLQRTARQQIVTTSGNPVLDWMFSALRRSTGLAIMFGNVANAAQQITGIANSAVYVKGRFLKRASFEYLRGGLSEKVSSLSRYMDERLNHQVGQVLDEIELSLSPSWWGKVQRWTARNAYFMQRFMQNHVDVVTWKAAFDQSMERTGAAVDDKAALQAAVDEADGIVRQAQGSQTPEDVARYEAGTPFARLWTQFSGYFNAILNQIASADGAAGRARAVVLAFSVPAVMGAAIQQALWGGWDDEDDDGYSDEVAAWFFSNQAKAAAALVPGVGPIVANLISTGGGDRFALNPAMASVQSLYRGTLSLTKRATGDKDKLTGRDVRDLLTALSVLSGVPVAGLSRPLGYQADVNSGKVTPAGVADYLRGLVTGRAAPGTR